MKQLSRPGGPVATRDLEFVWIVDNSGSMLGDKIESLNDAVRQAIPLMQDRAKALHNANILVSVIRFSNGAHWVVQGVPVEKFKWTDLTADGETDMGAALTKVAERLEALRGTHGLRPVLALVSDGQPTDDFNRGLKQLLGQPAGKRAIRVALAIGQDADEARLQDFIGTHERKPFKANNPDQLAHVIEAFSTTFLDLAAAPPSQVKAPGAGASVPIAMDIDEVPVDEDKW